MKISKFLNKKILISFLLISLIPFIVASLYLYMNANLGVSDIYWVFFVINSGVIANYLFFPTIEIKNIVSLLPILFAIRYAFVYVLCTSIDEKNAAYFLSLFI
jgi:hypothetical protein